MMVEERVRPGRDLSKPESCVTQLWGSNEFRPVSRLLGPLQGFQA